MTVLEASGELFNWFDKNDKFDLEEDISKLLKKPSKSDKAAVKCALDEFEQMECDPASISSSDIDNLLLICYQLINEISKETDPSKN